METLVIVDWENVRRACDEAVKVNEVFGGITQKVLERGTLSEIRLFVPNYLVSTGPWKLLNALQIRFGLQISVCPALREGEDMAEEYKDMVDFEILRWMMTYLHRRVGPELVAIVSGDGHLLSAAYQAQNRGKRVEFWTVDRNRTSGMILRYQTVRDIKGAPIPIPIKSSAFITALTLAKQGKELDAIAKQKIVLMQRAVDALGKLANGKKPTDFRDKIESAIHALQQELGVSVEDASDILKVLLAMEGIRIIPVASQSLYVDTASGFMEWLKQLSSTLT